jgi:hypothetical protein
MTACNPVISVSVGPAAPVFTVEMWQAGMWVRRVRGSGDGREEDCNRNCQRGENLKPHRLVVFENRETES